MNTLVTSDWLAKHLGEPDLVVLDCTVLQVFDENGAMRNITGRSAYEQGHIPGAEFADLTAKLSDGDSGIEFAPPTPERFCAAMGALGVGDDTRVVLYDANLSAWAARVWWMLRWVGFDRGAVLDGGLSFWSEQGRPLSKEPAQCECATLTPATRPRLLADRDEVRAAIDDETVQLVDTMPTEHYRGDSIVYSRPGHIPGAVNVSGIGLLDASGRFRPHEELEAQFAGDRDARAITYCGGGILASAGAFVMHRLGFNDVAVYAASLQEWTADLANPLVTGDTPQGSERRVRHP